MEDRLKAVVVGQGGWGRGVTVVLVGLWVKGIFILIIWIIDKFTIIACIFCLMIINRWNPEIEFGYK